MIIHDDTWWWYWWLTIDVYLLLSTIIVYYWLLSFIIDDCWLLSLITLVIVHCRVFLVIIAYYRLVLISALINVNSFRLLSLIIDDYGLLVIIADFSIDYYQCFRLLSLIIDDYGFLSIVLDFYRWLLTTFIAYCRWLSILDDSHWLLLILSMMIYDD